ncbi:MAG: hypothetical protein KatS3mg105_5038 [Gemmatales bacterium]|nr:MAG: hypothetical protein KatS3mg105_5038 [Gemmatales bacterium]
MLTIRRKPGQKILIGNDIVIVIGSFCRFNDIKIHIAAPKNISILRPELSEELQAKAKQIIRSNKENK